VTLYQMRADAAREVTVVGLQSAPMLEAYRRSDSGEHLTDFDLNLLAADAFLFLNHFENSHFLYRQGFLTEEHWQSDLFSIVSTFDDPLMMQYWEENRSRFRESFANDVERALQDSSTSVADTAGTRRQVMAAETAFARTMADRDLDAFAAFVADDAVFFEGDKPLRGKEQVVTSWTKYYSGSAAPFSWEPREVEVLDHAMLAHSSGPVRNADGNLIGCFNSLWRRDGSGNWKVIFDKGSDAVNCSEL